MRRLAPLCCGRTLSLPKTRAETKLLHWNTRTDGRAAIIGSTEGVATRPTNAGDVSSPEAEAHEGRHQGSATCADQFGDPTWVPIEGCGQVSLRRRTPAA